MSGWTAMAKTKKPKTIAVKDPQRGARVRRFVMHSLAILVFIGLLAAGYHAVSNFVLQGVAYPARPPKIVLKNRPIWMSDARAIQIVNSIKPAVAHSAFDKQLLRDTATILQTNPWVKQIKEIRRAYGESPADTIEVDCEYRAPIALVHWKDYFWLVDGEGVQLPEEFTAAQVPSLVMGQDRRLNIRLIEGVSAAPVRAGQQWPGEDLAAGLDLVKVLYGQPYAEEILQVDVSNFGGRVDAKEAQLCLTTKYATQIRWGRPINAKDFFVEVSANQKLKALEEVYREFHRVDGNNAWIDIRFDRITHPSTEATASVNGK